MSYAETLAQMIQNSHLTLRQIAERVKEHGVKVDPSYISKLQSGNQSPASDEINVALAKVCSGNPDNLVYEAYLEKAPEVVKSMVKQLSTSVRNLWIALNYPGIAKETIRLVNDRLLNATDLDLVREFYFSDQALQRYTDKYNQERDMALVEAELEREQQEEEELEAHMQAQREWDSRHEIQDDSMSPLIPKGSIVTHFEGMPLNNGDIVLVKLPDGIVSARRYVSTGEKVALIADNRNFPPIVVTLKDITILGRVLSYSVNL